MKALVLGGNGFIGSHVVDHLLASGHNVRVFDRSLERYRDRLPRVDYMIGNFSDTAALTEAITGVDVVYHLISTTVPSTSNKDPIFDIETNLVSTVRLLNLLRDSNVKRIVYLSSGGTVYGIPSLLPIPEHHPLNPICSYGVVKVTIEKYLHMYQHLYGIESVVLRASNPYGERQGHSGVQGVIGTFMEKVLNNESIEIWGDGNIIRDFIYVGDLAALCVVAGESLSSGVYNAGSGMGYSIRQILEMVIRHAVSKPNVKYLPLRLYDVPEVVLDLTKLRSSCDWEPVMDLQAGIAATWHWQQNSRCMS